MGDGANNSGAKGFADATQIAKLFNLTVRRVQQLTQDGIISTVQVGRQRRYELMPTVQGYIVYLQKKSEKKTSGKKEDEDSESRKLAAEAALKEAKAAMAQMELDEMQGKMHRSEDVEAMTTDLVFAVRGMVLALPGRLAMDLAALNTAAEISERIKQEVNSILQELSNYQYDENAYKKRVRDRQGWPDVDEGNDGGQ